MHIKRTKTVLPELTTYTATGNEGLLTTTQSELSGQKTKQKQVS